MGAKARDFRGTDSWKEDAHPPAQGDPLVAFYTGLARLAAAEGDVAEACLAYRRALRHIHIADAVAHGRYVAEGKSLDLEFASILGSRLPPAA
jgi:hypothetical protein